MVAIMVGSVGAFIIGGYIPNIKISIRDPLLTPALPTHQNNNIPNRM